MNIVDKLIKSLKVKLASIEEFYKNTYYKYTSYYDTLSSLFDINSIIDLTSKDLEFIKKEVPNYDQVFTPEEISILETIANLSPEMRKDKKERSWNEKQTKAIIGISEKLQALIYVTLKNDVTSSKGDFRQYRNLINKLKEQGLYLISEDDIKIIMDIVTKEDYSQDEIIDVCDYINHYNTSIYQSYFNQSGEDLGIDEDKLITTNIDQKTLIDLFQQYNINWHVNEYSHSEKMQALLDYICKYGNLDNIKELLEFISKDNQLNFILNGNNNGILSMSQAEILAKTFVLSTADKIKSLVTLCQNSGWGNKYEDIFKRLPTNFFQRSYPSSKTHSSGKNDGKKNHSGTLNSMMDIIILLKSKGLNPKEVFDYNATLFTFGKKAIGRAFNQFALYNINLSYEGSDHEIHPVVGLSSLAVANLMDTLDVAIECSCYNYIRENISKLTVSQINYYRVKYAKKMFPERQIFKSRKKSSMEKDSCLTLGTEYQQENNEILGSKPMDTFSKYGAVIPNFNKEQIYDEYLDLHDNDSITEFVYNNPIIKALDSNYAEKIGEETNPLLYNFDGVIISRLKVLRIYESLSLGTNLSNDTLLYCITYKSMLNEEEMTKIKTCLAKANQISINSE